MHTLLQINCLKADRMLLLYKNSVVTSHLLNTTELFKTGAYKSYDLLTRASVSFLMIVASWRYCPRSTASFVTSCSICLSSTSSGMWMAPSWKYFTFTHNPLSFSSLHFSRLMQPVGQAVEKVDEMKIKKEQARFP